MFQKANQYLRNGQYEEAITAYIKLIKVNPEFYIYHQNLSQAYAYLGKEKESVTVFEQAKNLRQQLFNVEDYRFKSTLKKNWEDPEQVQVMRNVKPYDESGLKAEYIAKGLDKEPDTFVLYRIIGNDLYPRHAKGQSRQNVEFMLKHEPELANCEKRWVVNRIFDQNERGAIIDLLEQYNQPYIEIPFVVDEFKQIDWDFTRLPAPGFLSSCGIFEYGPLQQDRIYTATYVFKNRYVMNNNGARNVALEDGKKHGKWILPWDGNCFVTSTAWQEIIDNIKIADHLKYFVVPMERITDNRDLLRLDFVPSPVEEPQLIFRRDAKEKFNPAYPYGRRPKVELFWRLGIPGVWDRWKDDPWDQERQELSLEKKQFGVAGWVARLSSGRNDLESSDIKSFKNRGRVRQDAITSTINHITQLYKGSLSPESTESTVFYTFPVNRSKYEEVICIEAGHALNHIHKTVVDKTEIAPSGDVHDYYHPAPFWWPNPDTLDGLPYVKRDGERVPGTVIYDPESNRYDRTSIQYLFDNGITLALAWKQTKDIRYAQHAAEGLRKWFIDPETRMNPHLIYSQVRRGRNKDQGNGRGNIETKDFYFYLDAVKILEKSGVLTGSDRRLFREWLHNFLDWLITSKQGLSECQAINNHGTYYDLQIAAIATFLEERELLFKALIRARNRLSIQISSEGWQYDEMKRTQTAHYCCFNLQGWLHLAYLAQQYGDDLFWHKENGVALLPQAVKWLAQHFDKPWPYEQIVEFDRDRFVPIAYLAESLGLNLELSAGFRKHMQEVATTKHRFHPHDGVAPYWQLVCDGKSPANFKLLHVTVMRFGIGIFDEVWLKHRFGLLSAITAPSLKKQNWQENMHFLVQVDELISSAWLEKLENLFSGFPLHIQKLQLHSDRRSGLSRYCRKQVDVHGYTHVLTTRIDDDDALSADALNEIYATAQQAIKSGVSSCVIAIKHTTRYLADRNLAQNTIPNKPETAGLSVLLDSNSNKNIYNEHHKYITNKYEYVFWLDQDKAKNLYVIHRMSDCDYAKRASQLEKDASVYRFSEDDLKYFGIDAEKLMEWIDLDKNSPTLGSTKTTKYIAQIEKQVIDERKRLKEKGENPAKFMNELLHKRKMLGMNIVGALEEKSIRLHGIPVFRLLDTKVGKEARIAELRKQKKAWEKLLLNDTDNTLRKSITASLEKTFVDLSISLKPPLVLEIGAHAAEFSTSMKKALPSSKIIAVEANPEVYKKHKEKLSSRGVEYCNVIVSERDGEREFLVPHNRHGGDKKTMGSILVDRRAKSFTKHTVQSCQLDTLVGVNMKNVMWVDVEGAILEVLKGGALTLSNCLAFYAEVEERARWEGQATLKDLVERLYEFDIIPVITDVQRKDWQSNVLFVHKSQINNPVLLDIINRNFSKINCVVA